MKIHADELLTFLAVAETQGVGSGAKVLQRSQPAVSERLRTLQLSLGEPLYQRQGRGIKLTAAGESLLPFARRLRESLEEVEHWAARRQTLQEGSLRIAASNTVANYFLMEHLARFRSAYPGVQLQLKTGPLPDDLPIGSWDLLFTEAQIAADRLPQHMEQEAWREDELVAILPQDHPWVQYGRQSATWEEVLQEPIVWREAHSGIRKRVEAAIAHAGLCSRYSVEVTGVEALRDAVAAGLGIGFASVEALDKVRWPLASLRLEPPRGLFWTLYLIHPQVDFQSRAVTAFLQLLATAQS
ncbi:MAG: LysR family transcriptional regulator [Acidithiobacillus sp.]